MFTIPDITHHEHAVVLVVVMLPSTCAALTRNRVFLKHRNTDMTKMIYFYGVSL